MGSDKLMEKYTRLLLDNPSKIPKDIQLYVPIMKRLNELTDDEIRQRIFPLFTPKTNAASIKETLAFNKLDANIIRTKMFNIILNHPNRVLNGWGLTNHTIKQEGMNSDEIAQVLKKKTHHVIPVIASDQIATLLPLVNNKTQHFGFVINSQSEKNQECIGKQYTLIGKSRILLL